MRKLSRCTCGLLVLSSLIPLMAATKNATDAKAAVESAAASSAPGGASISGTAGNVNVTALLGVLVMKGVLAPGEANAIREAAPEQEFRLLVEVLNRKGVLSAEDLNGAALPAPAAMPIETSSAKTAQPSELAKPYWVVDTAV